MEDKNHAPVQARTISISINRSFGEAYDFAHRPENFQEWAAGMSSSLRRDGERWIAQSPGGEATVKFSPRNDYGVLDHWVLMAGKPAIYIPMRMIANGNGTEVVFALFRQPEMDNVAFDRDAALVKKDLAALKILLERT